MSCRRRIRRLLKYGFVRRDAAQNLEEKLATTPSSMNLKKGIASPCVWGASRANTSWPLCTGDDITIGGCHAAVECLIKMTTRILEIKKQVTGEDADLEKSGRVLIRVLKWCSDGITIEADQRHVQEIEKSCP